MVACSSWNVFLIISCCNLSKVHIVSFFQSTMVVLCSEIVACCELVIEMIPMSLHWWALSLNFSLNAGCNMQIPHLRPAEYKRSRLARTEGL